MDLDEIIRNCEVIADKQIQNEFGFNPWDVSDASEFLNYICPECDEKFRNLICFGNHAVERHPKGRQFFRDKIPMNKRNRNTNILQKEVYNSHSKHKKSKNNFTTFDDTQNSIEDFDFDLDPIFENEENNITTSEVRGVEPSVTISKRIKKPKIAGHFELVASNVVKDLKEENQNLFLSHTENIFFQSLSNYMEDKENQSGFFLQLNPDEKILNQHNIKSQTSEMILAVGPANDAIFDEQAFQDNCKYIANAGVHTTAIEEWKNPKIEIDSSDPELPYKCSLCKELENSEEDFKFQFQFQLIQHFLNEHQIKDFEYEICQWCVEVFHDSQSFETHLKTAHNKLKIPRWTYECDKCEKKVRVAWSRKQNPNFHSAKDLIQHLNEKHQIHRENPYICDICEKTFCIHEEFLHHKLVVHVHEGEGGGINEIHQHICDKCPQNYFDENKYLVHQLSHDPETEIYFCKKCLVCVSTKKQLMEHYLSFHTESYPPVFVCFECDFYTMPAKNSIKKDMTKAWGSTSITLTKEIQDHYALEHNQPHYKPYICQKNDKDGNRCQYRGLLKENLVKHVKINHKGGNECICPYCGKKSNNENYLKMHIKRVHEVDRTKRDVFCDKCTYRTYSEVWLKRHNLRKHETEKHSNCDFCDKKFVFKCELEEHIDRSHPESGEKTYFCQICEQGYIYKYSVTLCKAKHKNQSEKSQKDEQSRLKSHLIGEKTQNKKKKKISTRIKTKDGRYSFKKAKCKYCQEMISMGQIPQHIFAYHPEKLNSTDILNCEFCGEKFLTNSTLDRHRRHKHNVNGYKNYCQNCKKHYLGNKTHKCQKVQLACDFCGKIFSGKDRLDDHVNGIHKNIRPYKCDICDKRWPSKKAKKNHMDQVHKRVTCEICHTEVYNMIALKHHRVLVHKKKEGFLCEYCPKKVFFCETSRNKHLKEKHSETQQELFANVDSDD